jgi:hypothetical protein
MGLEGRIDAAQTIALNRRADLLKIRQRVFHCFAVPKRKNVYENIRHCGSPVRSGASLSAALRGLGKSY